MWCREGWGEAVDDGDGTDAIPAACAQVTTAAFPTDANIIISGANASLLFLGRFVFLPYQVQCRHTHFSHPHRGYGGRICRAE